MNERKIKISSERIDDIPLILEWLKQMQIAKYIDQKLKKPHGNYQGMSYGQLSVLLLTYIITLLFPLSLKSLHRERQGAGGRRQKGEIKTLTFEE